MNEVKSKASDQLAVTGNQWGVEPITGHWSLITSHWLLKQKSRGLVFSLSAGCQALAFAFHLPET